MARTKSNGTNTSTATIGFEAKVTEACGKVDKGFLIDHRSKASRQARQEVLADDLDYTPADFDRSVVVPDQPSGARSTGREACPQGERGCARQIRTILRTYRDVVQTELFPGRTLVPKTLIFAKDDTHADDIVRICREVFGKGNDFCQKITYRTGFVRIVEKKPQPDGSELEEITWKRASSLSPDEILSAFRNSYNPRIAVTVDMIATGTDITVQCRSASAKHGALLRGLAEISGRHLHPNVSPFAKNRYFSKTWLNY